jgi:Rrf2 family protein
VISHTGQYAIRALVYLARAGAGANVTASEVAEATGLPPNYLTKILGLLVQHGILESTRGPHGGFRFCTPPGEVGLSWALASFGEPVPGHCVLGHDCCLDGADCPRAAQCRSIAGKLARFLETTTIADLARCGGAGSIPAPRRRESTPS